MFYRRREGDQYRNGLNWAWAKLNTYWWLSVVLRVGRIKIGFRYRSVPTPHFINYSGFMR